MALVLHVSSDMRPEMAEAIQRILSSNGFKRQGESVSAEDHDILYYAREGTQEIDPIVNSLQRMPGVLAAYHKPEGIPPI
jgi:hypothetical protein